MDKEYDETVIRIGYVYEENFTDVDEFGMQTMIEVKIILLIKIILPRSCPYNN
jgi:hypothetical protein